MNSWKSEVLSTVKSVKVHQSLAITTDHHRAQRIQHNPPGPPVCTALSKGVDCGTGDTLGGLGLGGGMLLSFVLLFCHFIISISDDLGISGKCIILLACAYD